MTEINPRAGVAFLGPEGTYSHFALQKYFGPEQTAIPYASIEDVFAAVDSAACDYAIVPVENSSEGSVTATLDCFNRYQLTICGEILLRIQQVLMAQPGTDQGQIHKIVSHQQSLGQCRNWLDRHFPGVDRVPVSSNGEAAQIAARETGVAAIASKTAADLNGLAILARDIEDSRDNTTRFLVISKKYRGAASDKNRTSLLITTRNEPGSLFRVLQPLNDHAVNLSKLESRPSRQEAWSYAFYIDIDGHQDDAPISQALSELRARDIGVKVLGSYPVSGIVHDELLAKELLSKELASKKIVIVGLGLIGGSIAKGLLGHDNIWAVGRDEFSLRSAHETGIIQGYSTQLEGVCEDADLIIIAVPGLSVASIMQGLAGIIKEDCVITDVASVKQSTLDAAREAFGEIPPNLVPGHPIAGSEKSGFEAARAELFDKHRVILAPVSETSAPALNLIKRLWESLGADVLCMPVAEHDKILAATSHLPHLLAYALVDTLSQQDSSADIFHYAAGGFRDFTRIAASDPHMWHDIFISNAQPIKAIVEAFEADLLDMKEALLRGDGDYLMAILQRVKKTRDKL